MWSLERASWLGVLVPIATLVFHTEGISAQSDTLTRTYFEFPHTLGGQIIRVSKCIDRSTGIVRAVTSRPDLAQTAVDVEELRLKEEARRRAVTGALKGGLLGLLDRLSDEDTVQVTVTMKHVPRRAPSREGYSYEEFKALCAAVPDAAPTLTIAQLLGDTRVTPKRTASAEEDILRCTLSKRDALVIAFHPEVASVVPVMDSLLSPCLTRSFTTLSNSAYNPPPMPSWAKGTGVRSATLESGITQAHFNCRNFPIVRLYASQVAVVPTSDTHTQQTFLCLFNTAPKASFWHYVAWSYGMVRNPGSNPQLQWIINNDIQTLSISYARGGQTPEPWYDCHHNEFVVMDDMAYFAPNPVFCNPTANDGYAYIANWHCYNAISVGNVKHEYDPGTGQYHYICADPPSQQQSQAANPSPIYGSSADREMPYVLAPGLHPDNILTDLWSDGCLGTWQGGGTSYSAPVCNGIAACVISANSAHYAHRPERVRAALMVTAHNVYGAEWNSAVDGRDGAGVVSGIGAASFAQVATPLYAPNAQAVQDACAWGAWANNDYAQKNFAVSIPTTMPAGKHLRIAFTWDSNPDMVTMDNSLSDFDLVFSPTTNVADFIAYSASWNANVEVVDIAQAQLVPGATYYALLTAFTFRVPAGASSTATYYSVAWTWVPDHAS